MDLLRFDGRTAIVTGAGSNPGMGRAHAMLLAARGANVVVNDIADPGIAGFGAAPSAQRTVDEIVESGGRAIAITGSVAQEDVAGALVEAAVAAFGSVDIIVNNAAVSVAAPLAQMRAEDIRRHLEVNLLGQMWLIRAAWPHMAARGFGRIVNIGSGAMAGMAPMSVYGASKGGVFSLTRGVALEGAGLGIRANTVLPGAFTQLLQSQHEAASSIHAYARDHLAPEQTSPLVAFLAHDSCPVNGECFETMGGMVRRVYLGATGGFADPQHSMETLAARWDEVMGAPAGLLDNAHVDTSSWVLKPYRTE